jgi:hypothetical protein
MLATFEVVEMVERNTHTDGGAYVPGRVNTDGGDFVGRDYRQTTIIFNSSSQEELKRYLKTAVANYERTIYGGISLSSASLDQPYKSLYPFEIEDADIFFGRDAAIEDLYEAVLKDRLTILHAKSGTGKTSLLNAGLSPRLILERRLPVYVRRQDDPVGAVKQSIAPSMSGLWPESLVELTLYEFLGLVCADCLSRETEELIVILDQFEEFFIFGPERERGWPFIEDLADCYNDKRLPVRFVIALRSDYFSHLATFQSHLPYVFYNEYYLEPMTREAARAAITEPVKKRGKPICYESTLLDNLLHDLKIVDARTHPDIELPHLQIICTQLYEEASDKGVTTITLDAYEKLGGTKGILGRYLNSRLKSLPGSEALIARDALKGLVGSEATRRRLPRTTLVARVNAREDELDDVLDRLVKARLLRRDEAAGEPMYEVVHEYLVEEIKEKWIDQEDLKFKEVEEMLDREMANWNVHKTLMPRDRLKLVYEQRERLKGLPAEKWKLILSSALETNFEVLDWPNGLARSVRWFFWPG